MKSSLVLVAVAFGLSLALGAEEKLETKVFRAPLDFLNLPGSTPEMKPVAGPDPFAPADPFAPPAPPVQHRPLPSSRKVREAHIVVVK